jgi:hypothetical protein
MVYKILPGSQVYCIPDIFLGSGAKPLNATNMLPTVAMWR